MNTRSDPLQQLLASEHDDDIDQRAAGMAAAHQLAATAADKHGDRMIAALHRKLAGYVFKALREVKE